MDRFWKRITPAVLMALAGVSFLRILDHPVSISVGLDTPPLGPSSVEGPHTDPIVSHDPVVMVSGGLESSEGGSTSTGTGSTGYRPSSPVPASTNPARDSTLAPSPATTKSAVTKKPADTSTSPSLPVPPSSAPSATPVATPTTTPTVTNTLRTILGRSVMTRYGAAQVKITVDSSGKIITVTPVSLPSGGNPQYSNYAEPRLRAEVLAAQSANVSMISGATYTSTGYLQSLQSALDNI